MAYQKSMLEPCGRLSCTKRAVIKIYGRRNTHEGNYCRACGKSKLAALRRIEKENDVAIRANPELTGKLA